MAITTVGDVNVDFTDSLKYDFPEVSVTPGRGTTFLLLPIPQDLMFTSHYLLVLANLVRGANSFELPLVAKYFPKGSPLIFNIGVPETSLPGQVSCSISVIPKLRFTGAFPDVSSVTFRLRYEDAVTTPAAVRVL